MPSVSGVVSSLIVTSLGVALIFRVDFIRGIVTGIQTADSKGAAPVGGRALYL